MKSGFVSIFGLPNAGKSTLLNSLMQEKLAIVSHKVQTTRHRIQCILTEKNYQLVFSDTPGIIAPKYVLQQTMMHSVKDALEDADVALLIVDVNEDWEKSNEIFSSLNLKLPAIVVLNKKDLVDKQKLDEAKLFFQQKEYCNEIIDIAALHKSGRKKLIELILKFIPEGEPYFDDEKALSNLPTKFFVSEIIREKIFELLSNELPYHTAVMVHEYKEKITLDKISAVIYVQRETQKQIMIGSNGSMIKKIGTLARKDIEAFVNRKVFLELTVKVKPKWRDSEKVLKEFGYE